MLAAYLDCSVVAAGVCYVVAVGSSERQCLLPTQTVESVVSELPFDMCDNLVVCGIFHLLNL